MGKILSSFLLLSLFVQNAYSQKIYTMGDLEVLALEKNYLEFFIHALDINPSNRQERWKDMVEQMGIDHLSELINKTELEESDYTLVHKLSRWPIFKTNEFFNKKRDFVFLREIRNCYKKKQTTCFKLATQIFNDYDHDAIFSFELTNTLVEVGVTSLDLWPIAIKLTKDPISEFYCNKGKFKEVVLDNLFSKEDKLDTIKENVHLDCLKVLRTSLLKELYSTRSQSRNHAHKILKFFNLLSASDLYKFHTINYLQNNNLSSSEIDYAIDSLKFFSKNHNDREKLMHELLTLDPVPDNLFSNLNRSSQKAKIRILDRYFPEYLISYAKTCLAYLKDTKVFKNGNPTPHCHTFFQSQQVKNSLPENLLKNYNEATYFLPKEK